MNNGLRKFCEERYAELLRQTISVVPRAILLEGMPLKMPKGKEKREMLQSMGSALQKAEMIPEGKFSTLASAFKNEREEAASVAFGECICTIAKFFWLNGKFDEKLSEADRSSLIAWIAEQEGLSGNMMETQDAFALWVIDVITS